MVWRYHTGFEDQAVPSGWDPADSTPTIETDTPNSGGAYLRQTYGQFDDPGWSSSVLFQRAGTDSSDANSVNLGMAVRINDLTNATATVGAIYFTGSSQTAYIGWRIGVDGSISVRTGLSATLTTATLATSAPGVIIEGEWNDIELRAYPGNAAGFYELAVNGVTLLSDSGVDTNPLTIGSLNTGVGWAIDLNRVATGGDDTMDFDDFRIGDGFTGPDGPKVHELLTVNSTTENDGTITGAATAHEALDEIPASDTDFVTLGTIGDRLLLGLTDRTETGDVDSIQATITASATTGVPVAFPIFEEGGTETDGDQLILTGASNTRYTSALAVNPRTGVAWTTADINALEIGVRRAA